MRFASLSNRLMRVHLADTFTSNYKELGLSVVENVVDERTEQTMLSEVDARLAKLDYAPTHFDGVITGYREFSMVNEHAEHPFCASVLDTLRHRFFGDVDSLQCHVLDYLPRGRVFKHVDNVEFAGELLVGVSLGSATLMRFTSVDDDGRSLCELMIPPRSAYTMRQSGRFEWTHETPPHDVDERRAFYADSPFDSEWIESAIQLPSARRVAFILRQVHPDELKFRVQLSR
jgi:hypothetical protein